jgi:hypothetical protein
LSQFLHTFIGYRRVAEAFQGPVEIFEINCAKLSSRIIKSESRRRARTICTKSCAVWMPYGASDDDSVLAIHDSILNSRATMGL